MKKSIDESDKKQAGGIELLVIGGSAGSLPVLIQILKSLVNEITVPIVIVIHRQRNVVSELVKILNSALQIDIINEPDDKEAIMEGCIYIAPQNYHLLIEKDRTFSLDYSEAIKYSRPAIDVTFDSAARVYKNRLVGLLLSGANNDGCSGMNKIVSFGGTGIAQDPETAEYPAMPQSALKSIKGIKSLKPENIGSFIKALIHKGN